MTTAGPVSEEMASMLASCTTCRLWAVQVEGPYRRNLQPERRDIVENRAGVRVQLGIRFARAGNQPLADATAEIWQCDALGRYSGFRAPGDSDVVTADTAPRGAYLLDQTFLRGRQPTDDHGMAEYRTIYPGWYPGRTVHIHLMVHTGEARIHQPAVSSRTTSATRSSPGRRMPRVPDRDTTNASDEIFLTGGDPAVLDILATADGNRAGICLVVPEVVEAS